MHLLIDGLGSRVGGGVTGLIGLVKALTIVAPENKYSIVLSTRYQRSLITLFSGLINVIGVDLPTNILIRTFYQNIFLNKIIFKIDADVVFFSGEGACFNVQIPSIVISGNLSLFAKEEQFGQVARQLYLYKLLRRPIALWAMRRVSKIGFVSSELRKIVLGQCDIDEGKTFLMPHGVDDSFYNGYVSQEWRQRLGTEPYFLSVSSINLNKGYELLLRAYADLPDDYPKLVIAGQVLHQPTYLKMLDLITEKKLENRVLLLGRVDYDKLPGLYSGAILFIFPSDLESFGIPLLEAMASGLPIVASSLPVCREVCDDAAVYFEKGKIPSLSSQIIHVMSNGDVRSELSRKAKQRSCHFTWQDTAKKFIAVAEQLSAVK